MKMDITTNKKLMCMQVVKFVSFLTNGITNEDTTAGTRIKFVQGVNHCSIAKASKNFNMIECGGFVVKQFIWRLVR